MPLIVGAFLAFLFHMTMSTLQPTRVAPVPDYHMPGRDEIEPGTNTLVSGGGVASTGAVLQPEQAVAESNFFGDDGMTFADLLDVLNPLQHIPVIGDIYRAATGDEISMGARLAGGTLYGGSLGFLSALANSVVEDATGKDIGGNVLALFSGDGETDSTELAAGAASAPDNAQLASHNPSPAPSDQASVTEVAAGYPSASSPGYYQAGVPFAAGSEQLAKGPLAQPVAFTVTNQTVPGLSPAAFNTLLNDFTAMPRAGERQGLAAGGGTDRSDQGTIRDAGLEINRLLRPHAAGQN